MSSEASGLFQHFKQDWIWTGDFWQVEWSERLPERVKKQKQTYLVFSSYTAPQPLRQKNLHTCCFDMLQLSQGEFETNCSRQSTKKSSYVCFQSFTTIISCLEASVYNSVIQLQILEVWRSQRWPLLHFPLLDARWMYLIFFDYRKKPGGSSPTLNACSIDQQLRCCFKCKTPRRSGLILLGPALWTRHVTRTKCWAEK